MSGSARTSVGSSSIGSMAFLPPSGAGTGSASSAWAPDAWLELSEAANAAPTAVSTVKGVTGKPVSCSIDEDTLCDGPAEDTVRAGEETLRTGTGADDGEIARLCEETARVCGETARRGGTELQSGGMGVVTLWGGGLAGMTLRRGGRAASGA